VSVDAPPEKADIVVGLMSYNDEETIGAVVTAVRMGVVQYFPGLSTRFVLADAGSTDDTIARARAALEGTGEPLEVDQHLRSPEDLLELPYHGIPGRARTLRSVLSTARDVEARVCVIVDGSVRTVAPHWLELLAGPVLADGYDFVSPYYCRHPHEGAVTKAIVYPVFRAVYGVRLRQPVAAEFACSSRLLEGLLAEDFWALEGAHAGVDLWLTTAAVSRDFRLCEAVLGERTHHDRDEGAIDLATTMRQVVGSLFADMESRMAIWQRVRGSTSPKQFGEFGCGPPPPGSTVELESLLASYQLGFRELREIWACVVPPKTIIDLGRLAAAAPARFRFDDELWARIIYDFALGYRLRVLARDHLLRSLVPLYLGWFASFILQVRELTPADADERIEQLGTVFEAQKPYLIAKWRWPERFRT
jgi:hypothetical protein